jgi:hypothetical protein
MLFALLATSAQPFGRYYVIACVDDSDRIRERDERSNAAPVGGRIDARASSGLCEMSNVL